MFPSTSALPMITVVTVRSATAFPTFSHDLAFTGTSIGVPSLFIFSALQVGIHFVSLISIGQGFLRLKSNKVYLASNANVGGPTTAAAMALAKEWKRLVLPALLVRILGYTTATPIALALGQILLKFPTKIG
eukprot:scaffold120_cov279-Chaetoceros_neogracile.AAC.12